MVYIMDLKVTQRKKNPTASLACFTDKLDKNCSSTLRH